jgi:hypothetical protein
LGINPLNAELYPICHLLALLGARHIFHVSRIRVKEQETRLTLHEHDNDDDDDDDKNRPNLNKNPVFLFQK